jgi:hypothetical protein
MVYFIQGETTRLVKIGKADDIVHRLRTLQSGSPDNLTVLAVLLGEENDKVYFPNFASSHHHGEWFSPTPDLLEFIGNVPESIYSGLHVQIKNLNLGGSLLPPPVGSCARPWPELKVPACDRRAVKMAQKVVQTRAVIEAAQGPSPNALSQPIERQRVKFARELFEEGEYDQASHIARGLDDEWMLERTSREI